MNNVTELLKKEFNTTAVESVPMSKHTSFKTGGNARLGIFPKSVEEFVSAMRIIGDAKHCVLGNGSNVIFPDDGYDGIVVFTGNMKKTEISDGCTITAECGAGITALSSLALKNSLSGLEFAYGIPGTVGGAVFMNAGAYDGEISQILESSMYLSPDGTIGVMSAEEHEFAYRHSIYCDCDKIILSCKLKLEKGDPSEIKAKMNENMAKRIDKQPLDYPSAGSVFKRPPNAFAGKLISDCGLKGYSIGGARVSEKHAGFIINGGDATSDDILALIEYVKNEVIKQFGIELECEVRYIC